MDTSKTVSINDLTMHFPIKEGLFSRTIGHVHAVDGLTFDVARGETLSLIGESGCGKSTAGKAILRLLKPTGGRIEVNGHDITNLSQRELRPMRREMQMVFQDPFSSLNPRMTAGAVVAEPLSVHKIASGKEQVERVAHLFDRVGLRSDQMSGYPSQFSGGQRQRIAIARALAVSPRLIIGDEPVSALDVSIQAQVINLLMDIQDEYKLSYIFIAHDLAVVEQISHQIAVMYLGRIVELAETRELMSSPQHPYTQALLSAIPIPDPRVKRDRKTMITGEVPSPINPPSGCHLHPRCPHAMDRCRQEQPELREVAPNHMAACHLH
jgi:oligopeptide/dipeptide ABC transporter ATP-binding protein